MMQDCLKKGALTSEDEIVIKGTAGTLYAAGTDTTLTSIMVFILAMVQPPDIFQKAQEEVIQVVGETRLPEFNDRTSLPYLENIITEVYRWYPAVPIGVPHLASDDDVYRGYYIPKGSMTIQHMGNVP
ncbi:cytochrome P450 [Rhodofomes roseus]|uniref:Cytochrome P450 n=1 Tax=Rhodofomes roseus TaxID=34475 RepID=A0ABQ8KBV2_9APHY|nr:cytochrome P450 [Rhodofomes roseus]KAH9834535.1 cytochrome P450 [Rhodofomes roseus]